MGLTLDSSVIIAAERGRFDMAAFIEAEAPMDTVFIASITGAELLHGVHRAKGEVRAKREAFVESVLRDTPNLPFDLECARHHARLWARLAAIGSPIGSHDMMIAATCMRFDLDLATLNEAEFARVDGLRILDSRKYLLED